MFEKLNYKTLLYLDIETVPITKEYSDLNDGYKSAWEYYSKQNNLLLDNIVSEENLSNAWKKTASLLPEFSKILCVSIGDYQTIDDDVVFKTYTRVIKNDSDNEINLLKDVAKYLELKSVKKLIAHAGKDFDYPFLIRRFLINGMLPPKSLQFFDKKPWEIDLFDLKEIWKFGGYKSSSLTALCAAFNIKSSKDGIDGSQVYDFYYNSEDKNKAIINIARYCSNDVRVMAMIVQKIVAVENPNEKFPTIDYV